MKYALISVYDKSGIIEFGKGLEAKGYSLLASGNTFKFLSENGCSPVEVSEVTKFPEMMSGRVKTLHPKIHGGILYKRSDQEHVDTLNEHGIPSIDMVVCNLYPFEEVLRKGETEAIMIENIDIGGPSMIRGAAKNFESVCVVVDPSDYEAVLMHDKDLEFRKKMAAKAFATTAQYDALITSYFNSTLGIDYPELLTQTYTKKQDLRYGENPHQSASYYERLDVFDNLEFEQIHGKELSYNNINDMTGALRTLQDFTRPTAVAVKHANACAIASGDTILEAYTKAYESDPVSIFGGIVALNEGVDKDLAKMLNEIFLEIVIAPSYSVEALKILQGKKNIRLIIMKEFKESRNTTGKDVLNGKLIQQVDVEDKLKLEVVSKRKPTDIEMADLEFAWKCVKYVDSNAIVLAKDEETLALGHGEVRRIWSVEKAIARSVKSVEGSVMASDAFFFEDTVEACAKAGITAIIQPGGSIHDSKVIELCDKYDIALVMSGIRHFKH